MNIILFPVSFSITVPDFSITVCEFLEEIRPNIHQSSR